jgi:flagellar basal body P-ring protein FlgI
MVAGMLAMSLASGCTLDLNEPPLATRPAGTLDDTAFMLDSRRALAMQGTVGSVAYVQGTRFMRVRGFGLVWDLRGSGSRTCPPDVRELVVREIRRYQATHPELKGGLTAEQLIDSMDTAVVEVSGDIPAGSTKGQVFDVFVSASGVSPDTRSVAGGRLFPCELRIYRESANAESLAGRTHGRAQGPLFVNPFADMSAGEITTGIDPREATIIGGGVNILDRRLALVTVRESYATVRQIMDAVNRRFKTDRMVADATTPTHVTLDIPKEYRGREARFLEIVLHLPLSPSAVVQESTAKRLIGELARPGPPPEDAALSLEGIGSSVIPLLQELYTHPDRQTSYYAARTGLRLGDDPAVEVVIRHARDPKSPFRTEAIDELGNCEMAVRASTALHELLADEDPRIRIRAHEALRLIDRGWIVPTVVGFDPENFILEAVSSKGPPLIYAHRTRIRRIAIIGADNVELHPPVLYSEPGKPITLSAQENDRALRVLRKDQGRIIGEFLMPFDVLMLTRFMGDDPTLGRDGKPRGLGLDYATVLDVLHHLCETGAINADMRWEEQSVEDIIGPLRPMGRPESEL